MLSKALVYLTGLALALVGWILFSTISAKLRILQQQDELVGVSNHVVLLVTATLHLAVGICVFATRSTTTQAIVLLWLGLNHLIYRVGLVWMGVVGPPPVLEALGLKFGVRPTSLDVFWKWFIAYLILGSSLVLFCEWRRTKRERAEEFMKNYQKKRRQLNPESGPG